MRISVQKQDTSSTLSLAPPLPTNQTHPLSSQHTKSQRIINPKGEPLFSGHMLESETVSKKEFNEKIGYLMEIINNLTARIELLESSDKGSNAKLGTPRSQLFSQRGSLSLSHNSYGGSTKLLNLHNLDHFNMNLSSKPGTLMRQDSGRSATGTIASELSLFLFFFGLVLFGLVCFGVV